MGKFRSIEPPTGLQIKEASTAQNLPDPSLVYIPGNLTSHASKHDGDNAVSAGSDLNDDVESLRSRPKGSVETNALVGANGTNGTVTGKSQSVSSNKVRFAVDERITPEKDHLAL